MAQQLISYVTGFMVCCGKVLLINKVRPVWQEGLANGVGGKIEPNETPLQAMIREFQEETGYHQPVWEEFCELSDGANFKVHFFVCVLPFQPKVRSVTDETVFWVDHSPFPPGTFVIPNLRWLLPMAFNRLDARHTIEKFTVLEQVRR